MADLHDEHGLKSFKESAIIYGFVWGIFGALLILSQNTVANIVLAMNISFLIRNRLDYLNHKIAATIIFISFLFFAKFDFWLFAIFFLLFVVFGSLKDYLDDYLTVKKKRKKDYFFYLNEIMLYYPIPALVYALITNEWIVFYVFLAYTLTYNLTKYFAYKNFSGISLT